MPQDRTLVVDGKGLRVERVRFHATTAGWGQLHRCPSPRLVLPSTGAVLFVSGSQRFLVDNLTALQLGADVPYRFRSAPEAGERTNVVVSEMEHPRVAPPADAGLLPPSTLFRLHRHLRSLERGDSGPGTTSAVLASAWQTRQRVPSFGPATEHVLRARLFLLAQPGCKASLSELADATHCSPFHLARSFRRHTGLSVHQYRQHVRLAAAMARLAQGEPDLAGLAHELGFCGQSHFGAVFRLLVGVTPAAARRALIRLPARI